MTEKNDSLMDLMGTNGHFTQRQKFLVRKDSSKLLMGTEENTKAYLEVCQNLIGDRNTTSLWRGNWHSCGPSLKKFSTRLMFALGNNTQAVVANIIEGQCKWPSARRCNKDVQQLISITINTILPTGNGIDSMH